MKMHNTNHTTEINKVFADDGTYGVEVLYDTSDTDNDQGGSEMSWYDTQEEQATAYDEAIKREFSALALTRTYRYVTVGFDADPIARAYVFEGDFWNGWLCPYFTKAEADKVADKLHMTYDAKSDSYTSHWDEDEDEDNESYKGSYSDTLGEHVYGIGAGSLVWDEWTEAEQVQLLVSEFEAWGKTNQLALLSADEMLAEHNATPYLTDAQVIWLNKFIARWEAVA